MRLLVLLETADDVRVPPVRDHRSGRVRPEWQARRLDPAAARALDLALGLKDMRDDVHVAVVVLGPVEDEPALAEARARGCDEAIRVWGDECRGVRAPGKAVILAAAVEAAGSDLVLAGASSADTGSAQVGILTAAHLGVPCATQVTAIGEIGEDGRSLRAARGLTGGFREEVEVSLPALLTVSPGIPDASLGSLPGLLEALDHPAPAWTLADIGVPLERVRRADGALIPGPVRTPRPVVRGVPAPDPAWPAFARIGALVRGTVRRREGRVVTGTPEEVADGLFRSLRDGGWLDHLRERPE